MINTGNINYGADGKCCCTGKPMIDSDGIHVIPTDIIATWSYPVIGNLYDASKNKYAIAIVHSCCISKYTGKLLYPIKWLVEFKDDKIIYHDIPVKKSSVNHCQN